MRFLLVVGAVVTVASMWYLLQGVDILGGANESTIALGAFGFLGGLLLMGFGLKGGVGR